MRIHMAEDFLNGPRRFGAWIAQALARLHESAEGQGSEGGIVAGREVFEKRFEEFVAGEPVPFRTGQGEKGGELFFIKTGKVELTVRNEATGESAVVAVVGDKSVLGTMSFLEGDSRSATAKCLSDVKAVVVNQAQRENLLKTVPQWFVVLVKDLTSSLRKLNAEFAHLKAENDTLKKRVAAKKDETKDVKN